MTDEPKKRSRFAAIFDEDPAAKKPRIDQPAAISSPVPVAPVAAAAPAKSVEELLEEKKKRIAELLAKTNLPSAPAGPAAIAASKLPAGQTLAPAQYSNNNMLTNQAVMSAIEKARSTAAQQKTATAPVLLGSRLGAAPNPSKKTMILKFDEHGRPVDEAGNVIGLPNKEVISSLKVNQRINKGKLKIEKPVMETDPARNPYFDPHMKLTSRHKERHAFSFHEQGYFEKMAEQQRAKAQIERLQRELEEKAKRAGIDALADITPRVVEPPKVPEIEWWDRLFVNDLSYDGIEEAGGIKEDLVTHLVQHPVPLRPPGHKESQTRELMLTSKERKKISRQKRLEAQKETQEKIALGLIPAPPPRITMSNFMRVLANDAIQDPTKMEKFARDQVEKRKNKHEAANEARKLTPEQRKEKLKLKLEKDILEHGTHVAVFRIDDLANHKFKTDKNAQQLHLTGCGILYKNMNLVIVEGGPRAIRKYKKLMLHRIKWNENNDDEEEDDDDDDDDDDTKPMDTKTTSGENRCQLVWEGEVKKAAFKSFRFKQCATELLIISFLEKFGVPQYWDFAKNSRTE